MLAASLDGGGSSGGCSGGSSGRSDVVNTTCNLVVYALYQLYG